MIDLPDITAETWHDPAHFTLQLALTPEHSCFRGHFENAPVLAGVVQLGWAFTLAEQKLQQCWQFRGVRSAKFQRLVLPPVDLQLDVQYLEARQMFKFRYSDTEGVYSSGGVSVAQRSAGQEPQGA